MKLTSPLALLVLLAAAGCGGGSSDSFTADYNKAVRPLSELKSGTGTSAGQFDKLADRTGQTRDNLAELDPPSDAQDEMDKLLSGLDRVTKDLSGVADAVRSKGSGEAGEGRQAAGEVERGGPAGRNGAAAGRRELSPAQFRIAGKSTTSRIPWRPLRIITRRSMPMPMPPVGGMPCSRAWT
jgi:hypothetical protein